MNRDLEARLKEVAQTPVLLVASDYDGTLSPLVPDPRTALPDPVCLASLAGLGGLSRTSSAIISGRSRAELARMTGAPAAVHLVGSHGAEDEWSSTPAAPTGLLAALERQLRAIAPGAAGLSVERKPLGVALHYRRASHEEAAAAVEAVLAGPGKLPGVTVRHGSRVVELCVTAADKGTALDGLRRRTGSTAVAFFGDDLTDVDAFRVLGKEDLGVEVGRATDAGWYRVDNVAAVTLLLSKLLDLRRGFLAGHGVARG